MRPLTSDMPNGRELIDELDLATARMMALSVDRIGTAEWKEASLRQQYAFNKWREYLHQLADDRVLAETTDVVVPLTEIVIPVNCSDKAQSLSAYS